MATTLNIEGNRGSCVTLENTLCGNTAESVRVPMMWDTARETVCFMH